MVYDKNDIESIDLLIHNKSYVPTKHEVDLRIRLIDLMREYEWTALVMDEIMHHDNPTVKTVFSLIDRVGPVIAHTILKRFIE